MDVQMPIMDGIEATKAIRAISKSLPIIAMTANVMQSDREKCLQAGMNDHIPKPFDPDELAAVLRRWLKTVEGNGSESGKIKVEVQGVETTELAPAPSGCAIDFTVGLKRTGGDPDRHAQLLQRFIRQHANGAHQIAKALANNDAATARRLAHSIKGAAGSLGALDLSKVAAEAELIIQTGVDAAPALERLAEAMNKVCDEVRAAFSARNPENEFVNGSNEDAGLSAPELLNTLKNLLESADGEAPDFFDRARDHLSAVLSAQEMQSLGASIGDFDFDTSLVCLEGISTRLAASREESVEMG
jgi:HPt (histidine-containing phosphotransfer) domain-containing protein